MLKLSKSIPFQLEKIIIKTSQFGLDKMTANRAKEEAVKIEHLEFIYEIGAPKNQGLILQVHLDRAPKHCEKLLH